MASDNANVILRRSEVLARTGLSVSVLYALMARGEFPGQLSIAGTRSVGWVESEVSEWIATQIARRDQGREVHPATAAAVAASRAAKRNIVTPSPRRKSDRSGVGQAA